MTAYQHNNSTKKIVHYVNSYFNEQNNHNSTEAFKEKIEKMVMLNFTLVFCHIII